MGFFGVKKRHLYPSGQRSFGVKAIGDSILIAAADAALTRIGLKDGRQTYRDHTLDRGLVFAVFSIPAATLLNRN